MIVDADRWPEIVREWGTVWLLNTNGQGREYVRRAHREVSAHAGQRGPNPVATLARLITRAKRGEVVVYQDQNPLNLRRDNLRVLTRAEAAHWRAAFLRARG